jgi:predicted nucleic acid-binding protein
MSGERFTIDTNILIYGIAERDGERYLRAKEVVDRSVDGNCCLTLQALSEFYAVTTKKGLLSKTAAAGYVSDCLTLYRTASASSAAVRTAIANATAGRASYWDALMIATAAEAGCTAIITEDLADGSVLGTVRIINPFARSGGLSEAAQKLLQ